jgi:hypothetical protein
MELDPAIAATLLLSPEAIRDLSVAYPDVADSLESTGAWTGRFERWVIDDFALRTSRTTYRLDAGVEKLRLFFSSASPGNAFGETVTGAGARFGNAVLATAPIVLWPVPPKPLTF